MAPKCSNPTPEMSLILPKTSHKHEQYSFKMGHTDRQTQIPKKKQENFENDEKKYVFFRLSLMKTRTDVKIKSEAFKYKKHV